MPKQVYLVVRETQSKKVHPKEIYAAYKTALEAEMTIKQKNRFELFGDRWTVIAVDEKEVPAMDAGLTKTSCF